jgi:hypothetical protein
VNRRWLLVVLTAAVVLGLVVGCSSAVPDNRSAEPPTSVGVGPDPTTDTASLAEHLTSSLERGPVLDELGLPDLGALELGRRFHTGFEDPADLALFYVTPQSPLTHHEVTTELAHTGASSHKAWVTGAGGPGVERDGPNHRGYPTIQLDKLAAPDGIGGFASPTLTELWVWLDVSLGPGQWFSFETFSNDRSDRWDRVVTVNLDPAGFVNIFHAPRQYQNDLAFQRTDVRFPMRTWVRLTTYLDLRADHGAIVVWQDGVLVSASRVDPAVDQGVSAARDQLGQPPNEITDRLERAHFGMYAPPEIAAALVYNDDLTISEVQPVAP